MSEPENIHLPGPSLWPPLLGLGVFFLGVGISLDSLFPLLAGSLVSIAGALGWMYDEIKGAKSY